MGRRATRRAFVSSLLAGAALAAKRRVFPAESERYFDRLTEFPVERLTAGTHSSRLPIPSCRAISRRAGFCVYASRREGSPQLFLLDHKDGDSEQITDAADLAETEFTLLPGDRSLLYLEGDSLRVITLQNLSERELYRVRKGWTRERWLTLAHAGDAAILIEMRDGVRETRRIPLLKGTPETILQCGDALSSMLPRPGAAGLLWVTVAGALWMSDGAERKQLPVPAGIVRQAWWQPDGASISYLHVGRDDRVTVREVDCAAGKELRAGLVTRYVHFAPNADASMFVGASGSAASPQILLLHRKLRRELTLCEHSCPDPAIAVPVFSPDSRRVYFVSGPAAQSTIRRIDVSRLVEET